MSYHRHTRTIRNDPKKGTSFSGDGRAFSQNHFTLMSSLGNDDNRKFQLERICTTINRQRCILRNVPYSLHLKTSFTLCQFHNTKKNQDNENNNETKREEERHQFAEGD
jgi:hypothetical protein